METLEGRCVFHGSGEKLKRADSQPQKPGMSRGQTLTLEPAKQIILGTATSPLPEHDSQSQRSPCHHAFCLTVFLSPLTGDHFLSPHFEEAGHYTFQRKEGSAHSFAASSMVSSDAVLSSSAQLQGQALEQFSSSYSPLSLQFH